MNEDSAELKKKIAFFLTLITKAYLEAPGRDLDEVDNEFQHLIGLSPNNHELLFRYNEFRIAHLSKLTRIRPRILTNGLFGARYPNIHSYPLFGVADVVCLTTTAKPFTYYSSLHCHPLTQFYDILKRLPKGFEPDFYWDNQVEQKHFIPAGIETAPFPIVASVCHMYLHKSIEHVCELFDWVCPVSRFYGSLLKKKYPGKIMDLPFGLNWASLDYWIPPCWNKTVDVCLTFAEDDSVIYCNHRNRVIELTKKFKEKYGNRFSIEIVSHLPVEKYVEVLRNSRIAINVTGIHGPYNYRVMEAMSAGAMIFQFGWKGEFFENDFSELFVENVYGVVFNEEDFESKLLYYLENPDITQKIAEDALSFLKENYTYTNLYQKLISHVRENPVTLPRNLPQYQGYHHLDMIYYNQSNEMVSYLDYGTLDVIDEADWVRYNNLMILSCTYPEHSHAFQLFLTVIASPLSEHAKADVWSLCKSFYEKAMASVPQEYAWIIRWNFILLSLEKGKATKSDLENMMAVLQNVNPSPFDETRLIYKYYVHSAFYPKYQLAIHGIQEFIELNMGLMKVIDQPLERAHLYRDYALKAVRYFLEVG